MIPRLGAWVAREPAAYQYLIESIRRFPDQEAMKSQMEAAGFTDVRNEALTLGIASIVTGVARTTGVSDR